MALSKKAEEKKSESESESEAKPAPKPESVEKTEPEANVSPNGAMEKVEERVANEVNDQEVEGQEPKAELNLPAEAEKAAEPEKKDHEVEPVAPAGPVEEKVDEIALVPEVVEEKHREEKASEALKEEQNIEAEEPDFASFEDVSSSEDESQCATSS